MEAKLLKQHCPNHKLDSIRLSVLKILLPPFLSCISHNLIYTLSSDSPPVKDTFPKSNHTAIKLILTSVGLVSNSTYKVQLFASNWSQLAWLNLLLLQAVCMHVQHINNVDGWSCLPWSRIWRISLWAQWVMFKINDCSITWPTCLRLIALILVITRQEEF